MPLNSGFGSGELTALPQSPIFPSNLGVVTPVNYQAIQQMALARVASQNQTLANQSALASQAQQRQQSGALFQGALAGQQAQVGQQQVAYQGALAGLPVTQATAAAQGALVPLAARVAETSLVGQANAAQRENDLLQKGTVAVPGIQAQIAQIDQLPDPNDRYTAYADLQAKNADVLGHPAFSSIANVLNERATQALGRVTATAGQQARLAQIAAVNQTRENVAGINSDARQAVAETNQQGRVAAAGGPVNVATQRVQDAEDSLNAALDTGDENAISAAEQTLALRRQTLGVASRAGGGRPPTPGQGRNPPPSGGAAGAVVAPRPTPPPPTLTGSAPMTASEYVPPLASMATALATPPQALGGALVPARQ